jgi:hypothetical protein
MLDMKLIVLLSSIKSPASVHHSVLHTWNTTTITTKCYRCITHRRINEGTLWNCVHWQKCLSFQCQFSNHHMMTISVETFGAPVMRKIILKLKKRGPEDFNINLNVRQWIRNENKRRATGCCSTISVNIYQTTWHHIPDSSTLQMQYLC